MKPSSSTKRYIYDKWKELKIIVVFHYGIIAGRDGVLSGKKEKRFYWLTSAGVCEEIAFRIRQESNRKNEREHREQNVLSNL